MVLMMAEEMSPDSGELLRVLHRLRLSTTPETADELLSLHRKVRSLELDVERLSKTILEVKARRALKDDRTPE